MAGSLDRKLAENYGALSARLRQAADYVARHPLDVTTRSLRSVAEDSGLPPATFSRMARRVGYASFEALREDVRQGLDRRAGSFHERAERLRVRHRDGGEHFPSAHMAACIGNIEALDGIDSARLEAVADRLGQARRVVLFGALGSAGIVEHMAYVAGFLSGDWQMAGRGALSLGAALAEMDDRDALLVVTKPPFARRSVRAAELGREAGAFIVLLTDSHACPALAAADEAFIVPSATPHFFSSYTATLCLLETVVGMVAARAGTATQRRVAEVEEMTRRLDEVLDGGPTTTKQKGRLQCSTTQD